MIPSSTSHDPSGITGELSYAKELTEMVVEYYPDHERMNGNLKYFKKELTEINEDQSYDDIYNRGR